MTQRHYTFGTGNLYVLPVGGGAPIAAGALQDVDVKFSGDIKQLFGSSSFALDVSRGKVKIEGKFSIGKLDLNIINNLFFGGSVTTGELLQAINEAGAVPAVTTYTVTAANGSNFDTDLGVYYAVSGAPFTQVTAGSEAVGKYSVNQTTGVYTFAAADASAAVVLNYLYKSASTGQTLIINNVQMGAVPSFYLVLSNTSKGKHLTLELYNCVCPTFDMPLKQDDYLKQALDFQAQDNGAGVIGKMTMTGG